MAAPVVQAASNCSWPAAAAICLLCLGICTGLERFGVGGTPGRWIGAVQWLWMLLLISEFLHWSMLCWPNHRSYHAVPLIILALAAASSGRGAEKASRAGGVLFWFLVVLLGMVTLSGVKQIQLENLMPEWKMQTAHLVSVMLIPCIGLTLGKVEHKGKLLFSTVAVSLVVTGVMGLGLIQKMEAPFYEMSRSMKLLGSSHRYESLVAAGMTLGYFVLTSYLLSVTAHAWDMGKRQCRSVWISAVFIGLVFVSGMRMNSRILALGTMAIWVVLPLLKKIVKNFKMPIDKTETT